MTLLAANLNDAGISVLDADRVLYREPGFALLDDERLTTGSEAFSQARLKPRYVQNQFWFDLQTTALANRRFRHLSAADLVSRQLEQIWRQVASNDDELIVAVPAYMSNEHMGLLLGIAKELKIPIVAMVDAAVAATRREYKDAVPVHIDVSLHTALLTRVAQSGQAQVDRSVVIDDSGIMSLHDAWIHIIAEGFVQQSRFDPLHTAETEQVLQDRLSDWIAAAAIGETITLEFAYRGVTHTAELESLEFIAAAAPVYHRIVGSLRALFQAHEVPALQLSERVGRMPGLADMLTARVGGHVFLQEPGATARGLLSRCRDMQRNDKSVSLIRALPWDRSPVEIKQSDRPHNQGQPTHLLFDDMAYALDAQPLTLGSQSGGASRTIELRQDMPGLSRQHCAVQQENGQCIVRDLSRYGTFLNGHRIDGSAVLQVGDLIRLGTPGFELRLITTENSDGA